jgi:hypothetical protein
MDGSRAARLDFDRVRSQVDKSRDIDLVPGVYEWDHNKGCFQPSFPRVTLGKIIDEHKFDIEFPEEGGKTVSIPYALLKANWTTAGGGRMGIMLSVRLVRHGQSEIRLEPCQ